MREIKFRAWDKNEKKMFMGDRIDFGLLETDSNIAIGKYPRIFLYNNIREKCYWINDARDFELMQYTGLKDRTGVEIYEGDVLQRDEYDTPDGSMYYEKCIVVWDESAWKVKFYDDLLLICDYKADTGWIIGNIYENPELINAET